MTTTNEELKYLIEAIPERTRDVFREMATEIAEGVAASVVVAHRRQCDDDRSAAEIRARGEIRISKKSAMWWVKILAAILALITAGAGAGQVLAAAIR